MKYISIGATLLSIAVSIALLNDILKNNKRK